MKMLSHLTFLAGLALPLLGAAQAVNTDLARDRSGNFNNGYSMVPPDNGLLQREQNLLPTWAPATVLLAGNKAPIAAPLKYDLYHQELRVRRPAGDSVVVPLSGVQEFAVSSPTGSRRFVCYPAATLPTEVGGGCGEVLASGMQLQLLKYQKKTLVKPASSNSAYAAGSTASQLEDHTYYYLRWADGHFTPTRLKRASLEQALTGQPAALAALKARKGNLGSEADMAAALLAIDPLLTVAAK